MKKSLGMFLVVLLLISFTATCFAFPAPGEYESVERERGPRGESPNTARYYFTINKSGNNYSGTMDELRKGILRGTWAAPLNVTKNNDGRFAIEVIFDYGGAKGKGVRDLEEISNNSFKMYSVQSDGTQKLVGLFNRI